MKQIIPDELLSKLICSQCKKYLSVLPIMVYSDRSVKCGRCFNKRSASQLDADDRIRSKYELIAEHYMFPCINRFKGCGNISSLTDMAAHEKICYSNRAPSFMCPLCLDDPIVYITAVNEHLEHSHPNVCRQYGKEIYLKVNDEHLLPNAVCFYQNDQSSVGPILINGPVLITVITNDLYDSQQMSLKVVCPYKCIKPISGDDCIFIVKCQFTYKNDTLNKTCYIPFYNHDSSTKYKIDIPNCNLRNLIDVRLNFNLNYINDMKNNTLMEASRQVTETTFKFLVNCGNPNSNTIGKSLFSPIIYILGLPFEICVDIKLAPPPRHRILLSRDIPIQCSLVVNRIQKPQEFRRIFIGSVTVGSYHHREGYKTIAYKDDFNITVEQNFAYIGKIDPIVDEMDVFGSSRDQSIKLKCKIEVKELIQVIEK